MMASSPLATSQYCGGLTHSGTPLFQPPRSPASISTSPSYATATDYFSTGSRKRQRPDSSHSQDGKHAPQQSWTETPSWAQCPTPSDTFYLSGYGQDSRLVNEKYRLAGGFDTPSLQAASATPIEHLTVGEHEFRRRFRGDDMETFASSGCTPLNGPLARERNGQPRLAPADDQKQQTTWTGLAFTLVGKVFSFGSNVVRGFSAGGGKAYDLNDGSVMGSEMLQNTDQRGVSPLPGSWLSDEALGDFEQDNHNFAESSPSTPAAKRRQTDRESWVIVGATESEDEHSKARRKTHNSLPRNSLAPPRPGASRASSRRSLAPVSRRQSSYTAVTVNAAQQPLPASPMHKHVRNASTASTRSPQGRPSSAGVNGGFISPEAERHARRQAKQDRVAEQTMTNMGARIQEMMRQAQEALGTKYSVEGDVDVEVDDEGFVDEEADGRED